MLWKSLVVPTGIPGYSKNGIDICITVGNGVWLNRPWLFYLWQKTESHRATAGRHRIDDLPLFYRRPNPADYRWCGIDGAAIFRANLGRLTGNDTHITLWERNGNIVFLEAFPD